MRVQIKQPLQQILAKRLHDVFWDLGILNLKILEKMNHYEFVLFDELHQIASRAVFKNDPQMISGFVPIVEFEDIEMVQIIQNFDLGMLFSFNRKWTYLVENLRSS